MIFEFRHRVQNVTNKTVMRRYGDKASQKDGREGAEAPGRDHAAQVPGKNNKGGGREGQGGSRGRDGGERNQRPVCLERVRAGMKKDWGRRTDPTQSDGSEEGVWILLKPPHSPDDRWQ